MYIFDARIFICSKKFREIPGATLFCVFHFFLDIGIRKNAHEIVFCGDLRMDTFKTLVYVEKIFSVLFLTKILDPKNFTFDSENGQKRPNK